MSAVKPLVRLGGVFQTEDLGDGNLYRSALDRAAEPLELATTGLGVVGLEAKPTTLSRCRLDSVRIGRPTAASQGQKAATQAHSDLQNLGLGGTIAYLDFENFKIPSGDTTCEPATLR